MWHFFVNWLAAIGAVFVLFAPFMAYHTLITSPDDYKGHRYMALAFMWIIYGFGVMVLAAAGVTALGYRIFEGHW